nr:hypothetical protein [Tanacetum cinerariifolium]
MSTQQDIYADGSESRSPMLNKENYVPWSSRLLWYAKSRPNGKLIHNSILNGPYVRRMIPEPGDANHEVTVTENFYVQTDDELSDKEIKQIKADDQAIQTNLLGLTENIYAAVDSCESAYVRRMIPEPGDANHEVTVTETFYVQTDDELSDKEIKKIKADDQAIQTNLLGLTENIYAAVDSCESAQEIWLRVQQMMKGSDTGIQENKAKLFNECERNKHFPEKIASNLKFLNNLQPEWSRHATIIHQTKDLHTANYTQLYDFLKYNQKVVDELKAKRLTKTQYPLALMANSDNPYAFPAPHQDQSELLVTTNAKS